MDRENVCGGCGLQKTHTGILFIHKAKGILLFVTPCITEPGDVVLVK
jgi:hypothetical protein